MPLGVHQPRACALQWALSPVGASMPLGMHQPRACALQWALSPVGASLLLGVQCTSQGDAEEAPNVLLSAGASSRTALWMPRTRTLGTTNWVDARLALPAAEEDVASALCALRRVTWHNGQRAVRVSSRSFRWTEHCVQRWMLRGCR